MNDRKISAGLYFTCATAILALVGFIFYMINTKTAYFAGKGVSTAVVACLIAAIVCAVIYVIVGMKDTPLWADIFPIATSALLMAALMSFASARINGIAAIMTFENNESNMADLKSAIIGIVFVAVAWLVSLVASFMDVSKAK